MRFKESLSAKIAAIIFSYIMALVLVASVAATVVMGYYKFYFSEQSVVKEEILTDMAQNEAYHLANLLEWETNLEKYYKDKNVFYRVTYINSDKVLTNYNGEPYIATADTGYYEYEEYYVENKEGGYNYEIKEIMVGDIEVFIAKDMHKSDLFSVTAEIIDIGYRLRFAMVFIALGSLAAFIFLLCFLFCAAGHRQGGVIKCNLIDRVPFDFINAVVVVLAVFSILIVDAFASDGVSMIIWLCLVGSVDYFIALGYTMSFATRIKTRTLIKNNILYYILSFIGKKIKKFFNWIKYIFSNCSLLQKTWIVVLAVVIFQFIFTIAVANNLYDAHEVFVFAMFFATAFLVCVLLYLAVVLQKIKLGGERIANGDLQYKIDAKYMFGDFKEFAESLNNINEGLQTAVNEKMKSERFKTELITNVSHDIKTPLTSIINYVDLIKKEDIDNETVRQYIEVLDRQSGRLKKLVEDLVEASKASSGSLSVNLSACNVGVLLTQAVGEFEDRLKNTGITPVVNIPEVPVVILADGRHLWRIFDNLLSNVCKYALSGTRVYLDIKEEEEKVAITFRNISKFQLNVTEEELLERFVRGDASRNTEGSGLGLS
ncbi:MAG: HAMP domain-containing histidine kinase, partial [Clostridia bacterium]|nr:HAMP domain-containing histidine kinase [Clostridia bacterium]